jgi:FkbM family methyltransferase
MSERQNSRKRPEDRQGLRQGTPISAVSVASYRLLVNRWRALPNFRGKVRLAKQLKTFFGLDNHHILETVQLITPQHYSVALDLHSWHEFLAFIEGEYEAGTVRFLVRCYDNQGVFLDIGANIGLISPPFAATIDPTSEATTPFVYSVEAVKSNYLRLVDNIRLNGRQSTIMPIGKAVGEYEKSVEIQVEGNVKDGEGTGTANILATDSNHTCERIPLTITTLDNLKASGQIQRRCSLMKIDVHGYDFFVLQGAKQLLSDDRPIIFGEFNSHCLAWHGHSHDDVRSYLEQFEYEVFSKSGKSWNFIAYKHVDQDLLMVPKEKTAELSWCCERGLSMPALA